MALKKIQRAAINNLDDRANLILLSNENYSFARSAVEDTEARWNITEENNGFTISGNNSIIKADKPGWYNINWSFITSPGAFTNIYSFVSWASVRNSSGTELYRIRGGRWLGPGTSAFPHLWGSGNAKLLKDYTVRILVEQNYTSSWGSYTTSSSFNYLNITEF